ncbi:DNA helicase [Bacillus cereus]|uniref:DNA 5'-3' helicase n=1 Tax=Bacillus cereus TaxID=1396 RepID=A0A9X7CIR6_BACCE|nr:DnaB-like helicase C-terminal domain-containing protein [Bacillus cereus]PGS69054.1 DNA helicase [Bacillus cereus]
MEKYQRYAENELYMLGCLMKDNTLFEELRLTGEHFIHVQHKQLFQAMMELWQEEKPINDVSLSQVSGKQIKSFGGVSKIYECHRQALTLHNFQFIQQKMMEFIAVDDILVDIKEFERKTEDRHSLKDLNELVTKVNKIQIATVKPQLSFQAKLQMRVEEHIQMQASGLSGTNTGFANINHFMDGWQPTDLIVVAARPSVGKTAITLDTMRKGAKADPKRYMGTFFSCEMIESKVIDRWIAAEGRLPVNELSNPNKFFGQDEKKWKKYQMATADLSTLPINIRSEKHMNEIKAVIWKIVKDYPDKKHLFVIDHLGHIKTDESFVSNHLKFTYIINELKDIQKAVEQPIILIAQLNRAVEGKQDKRPSMSDIRESGSIEEVADVIIFPHRDAYFDKDRRESEEIHETELIVAKNRNGAVGTLTLNFVKRTNEFVE